MTNYNASRGFMYTSLPGADSKETTQLTATVGSETGTDTETAAVADD